MKYGGQGGWRAVKRLNRDARINDGLSPYGYRTRYHRTGKNSSNNRGKAESIWNIVDEHPVIFSFFFIFFIFISPILLIAWLYQKIEPFVNDKLRKVKISRYEKKKAENPMMKLFDGQCEAKTKKGTRCLNNAVNQGLCKLHLKKLSI